MSYFELIPAFPRISFNSRLKMDRMLNGFVEADCFGILQIIRRVSMLHHSLLYLFPAARLTVLSWTLWREDTAALNTRQHRYQPITTLKYLGLRSSYSFGDRFQCWEFRSRAESAGPDTYLSPASESGFVQFYC